LVWCDPGDEEDYDGDGADMERRQQKERGLCRCTTQANKATTNITQGQTNKAPSNRMLTVLE